MAIDWGVVRAIATAVSAVAASVATWMAYRTFVEHGKRTALERDGGRYDALVYSYVLKQVSEFTDDSLRDLESGRREIELLAEGQETSHAAITTVSRRIMNEWNDRFYAFKARVKPRIDAWGDAALGSGFVRSAEELQDGVSQELERLAGGSSGIDFAPILLRFSTTVFQCISATHPYQDSP